MKIIQKIAILLIIILGSVVMFHETHHIALILLYAFPANLFLVISLFIWFILNKYACSISHYFPQVNAFFQILTFSFFVVTIVAPVIILYSNNFCYNDVLSAELSIIDFRDKFISFTNLDFAELLFIFFMLLIFSFILSRNLLSSYIRYSNAVNYMIIFLFSITSFSLTSHYFINKKSLDSITDLRFELYQIQDSIVQQEKFILACNILQYAFTLDDFTHILKNERIEEVIQDDNEFASNHIANYIGAYVNEHTHKKTTSPNIEKRISHKNVIKKLISNISKKNNKLTVRKTQASIIKSNTVNLISDILNKLLQTEQTAIFKLFANTLIGDLNGKISNNIVEYYSTRNYTLFNEQGRRKFISHISKFTFIPKTPKFNLSSSRFFLGAKSFKQRLRLKPRVRPKFRWFRIK